MAFHMQTRKENTMITNEQVSEMIECLRTAEKRVEGAAQKMCDLSLDDENLRELWSNLNKSIAIIGNCIHRAGMLYEMAED